jgi:site-specific DNA-methyltransferase (adenine-specific)
MQRRRIGRQTIVQGDCLAVMREMPAGSVDMAVTSPPYNVGAAYTAHDDRQPREVYLAWLAERLAEVYRVLRPAGSFFLNISGHGTADDLTLPHAIEGAAYACGFQPQNRIVWNKIDLIEAAISGQTKPIMSPRFLDRAHEIILHLTKTAEVVIDRNALRIAHADKSNVARWKSGKQGRCLTNSWFIPYETVQSRAEKFDHPAGFPPALPLRCIQMHGVRPDLVVLDPFAGTGSTLVAAQALGCRGIGIEIDPVYVATAERRLRAAMPQPAAQSIPPGPGAEAGPKHSRIGPSSAALVWHCAGSLQAQDAAGRPAAGEAAERGSDLHALAERLLRSGRRFVTQSVPPEVAAYVAEVRRYAATADAAPLIEHRLDLSGYHPELYGTLDAAVVNRLDGTLAIFDFKTGARDVPADALQLKLYGGMAFVGLPADAAADISEIITVVVQPNGSGAPVRRARHRVADVLATLSEYVERAHIATGTTDPPRTAGPWCREYFCAARATCPAFAAVVAREAQDEFTATATGDTGTD